MPGRKHRLLSLGRWFWRSVVGIAIGVAVGSLLTFGWVRQVVAADPGASSGLDAGPGIMVSRSEWFVFRPKDEASDVGLIFYPGGKADPVAYAPILRALASRGYFVVMTPMPLNLAILDPDRAAEVMRRFPQITRWVVGGHNLGGVVAAAFAARHARELSGLLLWAAYPAPFSDLATKGLPVLSVLASRDQLTGPEAVERSRRRLPPGTNFVAVAGGDHWNFGNFRGVHGTATISREDQQARIVEATAGFLGALARPPVGPSAPIQ
jgi:pimeloyl-ACP methyl ester carboxylesterase